MLKLDAIQTLKNLLFSYLSRFARVDMLEHIGMNVSIEAFKIDLLHELLDADLFTILNMLTSIDV